MSISFSSAFQQALVSLGVLDPDDTPSTSQANYGFLIANNLLANLSLERANIVQIVVATAVLPTGVPSVTFGPGGTFGGTRFVKLVDAGARLSAGGGTGRTPVKLVTEAEYSVKFDKASAGLVPEILWYDNGSPLATGRFWPVIASGVATTLEVEAWQVLNQFADQTTAIDVPYGFDRALVFLLAKDLMSGFSADPARVPTIMANADSALAAYRSLNASMPGQNPPAGPVNAIVPQPQQPAQ